MQQNNAKSSSFTKYPNIHDENNRFFRVSLLYVWAAQWAAARDAQRVKSLQMTRSHELHDSQCLRQGLPTDTLLLLLPAAWVTGIASCSPLPLPVAPLKLTHSQCRDVTQPLPYSYPQSALSHSRLLSHLHCALVSVSPNWASTT